ncbi:MAG: hypothetical protein WCP52_06285 [Bacteroidota bacterium]
MNRTIYLSRLPQSNNLLFKRIVKIINRAGMQVLNHDEDYSPEKTTKLIESADIILSVITSEILDAANKNLYVEIKSLNNNDIISKKSVIVWCSKDILEVLKKKGEYKIIEGIKKLVANQHFISYSSLIKLVDDLRRIKLKVEEKGNIKKYDITFISNENDKLKSEETQLLISDILKINPLYIDFSKQENYATVCSDSIINSSLCVVFCENSTEWAINFSLQIWKLIGGASSQVPILVIFNKETISPKEVKLEVPNIYKLFTEDTLAGLEIKMFYEKLKGI